MDVLLRCRTCGRVLRLDARTAAWPDCECGDADWRLLPLGAARVERAADDEGWKNSLDEYLTNDRRRF